MRLPRSRLFWKIFALIWLVQACVTLGVSVSLIFWIDHQRDQNHWRPPPGEARGYPAPPWASHPPTEGRPPPPDGHRPPPLFLPLSGALFVSLISAALLAWYFSKPIRALRRAFDAAAAGRLDVRLGAEIGSRQDELADLGRDFDHMADRLGNLMDGQNRLLHDVSHELRSPLARLQVAIGLLRQADHNNASMHDRMLERIERESVRMDKLVDELLTLSRLEASPAPLDQEPVDLRVLLEDVVADARFESAPQHRELELSIADPCFLAGNAELLHRAIENVVRNALLHTEAGTPVCVEMQLAEPGWVRILVLDRGPGLPELALDKIFAPFTRHTDRPPPSDGHGLGLAIAQQVVLAHGGRITASNRDHGGLCIEILLPCAAALKAPYRSAS